MVSYVVAVHCAAVMCNTSGHRSVNGTLHIALQQLCSRPDHQRRCVFPCWRFPRCGHEAAAGPPRTSAISGGSDLLIVPDGMQRCKQISFCEMQPTSSKAVLILY